MIDFRNDRVKRFWSNDALIKKHIDVDVILKISSLKEKCLSKVDNGEWTSEEYENFVKFINKMELERFSHYYDLIKLYLDLPENECRLEIEYLRQHNFIIPNDKINSFTLLLASSIYDLQAQIYKLASAKLTKEEENGFETFEERIEFYENLLKEIRDPNSNYNKVLLSAFNSFIESTVNNQTLKQQILDMNNIIITYKLNNLMCSLKNLNWSIEKINNSEANDQYYSTITKNQIKKHRHRPNKRR